MKTLLWLDDVRDPNTQVSLIFSPLKSPFKSIWVKSYDQFVDYITKNGLPDAICFDHDLGNVVDSNVGLKTYHGEISQMCLLPYDDYAKTGMDCAKWLVSYCIDNNLKLPLYNIQSANPVGKQNIDTYLKNFIKHQDSLQKSK